MKKNVKKKYSIERVENIKKTAKKFGRKQEENKGKDFNPKNMQNKVENQVWLSGDQNQQERKEFKKIQENQGWVGEESKTENKNEIEEYATSIVLLGGCQLM